MHKIRFALAPGEDNYSSRLEKSLALCENIMNIIFKSKKIDLNIILWQADDWRIAHIMLMVQDIINSSDKARIVNNIKRGKISDISIEIIGHKFIFQNIKGLLNIFLAAELGTFEHLDISVSFNVKQIIYFRPYDDRGADLEISNGSIYNLLLETFPNNIIKK